MTSYFGLRKSYFSEVFFPPVLSLSMFTTTCKHVALFHCWVYVGVEKMTETELTFVYLLKYIACYAC